MTGKTAKTLKVAVTGGAGSGKTSVCNRLTALGLEVISADRIAREVVSPGSPVLRAVADRFGDSILQGDGSLNRSRLREQIVADKRKRKALEEIMHPAIVRRLHEAIDDAERRRQPVVVVEVPLLFELDLAAAFDLIVMVAADRKRKVQRLVKRDGVSRKSAEALIDTQLPDPDKIKQSDIIIENDASPESLERSVQALYCRLRKKSRKTLT